MALSNQVKQTITVFDGVTKGIATNDTTSIIHMSCDRLVLELQLANTTTPSATVTFQVLGPVGLNPSAIIGTDYSNNTNIISTATLSSTTPLVLHFDNVVGLTFILTLTAISGTSAALTATAWTVSM